MNAVAVSGSQFPAEGTEERRASLAPHQGGGVVTMLVSSPCIFRYGDDAQLRAVAGHQPVAVVRLQQQREQQAGVSAICGAFREQPMPPLVRPLVFVCACCVVELN